MNNLNKVLATMLIGVSIAQYGIFLDKKTNVEIDKINSQLTNIEEDIKVLDNQIQLQNTILNKGVARLTEKHINNSRVTANRGADRSEYSFYAMSESTVTAYELDCILEGTELEGLGYYFVKAELDTKVNAVFLMAVAITESGWGKSNLAREKNNLFGFNAIDNNPYNCADSFSSKGECILYVADFIANNYCKEGGRFYRGGTIAHIGSLYASDKSWASTVYKQIVEINVDIAD